MRDCVRLDSARLGPDCSSAERNGFESAYFKDLRCEIMARESTTESLSTYFWFPFNIQMEFVPENSRREISKRFFLRGFL